MPKGTHSDPPSFITDSSNYSSNSATNSRQTNQTLHFFPDRPATDQDRQVLRDIFRILVLTTVTEKWKSKIAFLPHYIPVWAGWILGPKAGLDDLLEFFRALSKSPPKWLANSLKHLMKIKYSILWSKSNFDLACHFSTSQMQGKLKMLWYCMGVKRSPAS